MRAGNGLRFRLPSLPPPGRRLVPGSRARPARRIAAPRTSTSIAGRRLAASAAPGACWRAAALPPATSSTAASRQTS